MPDVFTAADARHWALLTRAALAASRTEIDALNVFPVPDGDTGTNLYLTFDAAIDEVVAAHEGAGILGNATLVQECRTLKRAILLSARGNSGVIVSQLVGGLCDAVIEREAEVVDALLLADAFAPGPPRPGPASPTPRRAPSSPSRMPVPPPRSRPPRPVARSPTCARPPSTPPRRPWPARPTSSRRSPAPGSSTPGVPGACSCSSPSTGSSPGAGPPPTRGCSRRAPAAPPRRVAPPPTPGGPRATAPGCRAAPPRTSPALPGHDPLDRGRAARRRPGLRGDVPAHRHHHEPSTPSPRTLDGLGDSLLVVGGPDLWNVHVHVDDPGAAVEAGIAAGRPERIRITHFATQVAARDQPAPLAVVACAAGPGIGALLREAGAVVVASGPGRRASAGQLLEAVESTGSPAVVLLPGDRDTLMAAEIAAQAAAGAGIDAHVVPARTTVQALAALAVLDPTRSVHANVVAMTGAAVATRHGAVSVATKEALTWAGVCHPGDVLGIVDGDVAFLGTDVAVAAREVLDRLLSAGGELVTLVVGADAEPGLGDGVAAALEHDRPELEVVVIDGGQPVYPLLVGVE